METPATQYTISELRALQRDYKPMEPSNVSKAEIFRFAEDLAKSIGFEPGADIRDVVTKNGGRIHCLGLHDLPDHDGTIYVHRKEDFDIIIPNFTGPLRDRFTIAHELGHYILHKPHEKSWAARSGEPDRLEWEANWFAAGFLMPEGLFKEAMDKTTSIPALASQFGVSLAAAGFRHGQLS